MDKNTTLAQGQGLQIPRDPWEKCRHCCFGGYYYLNPKQGQPRGTGYDDKKKQLEINKTVSL